MMATAHALGNEWSQPFHVYGPGEGKLRRNAIRRTEIIESTKKNGKRILKKLINFWTVLQQEFKKTLLNSVESYLLDQVMYDRQAVDKD